MADITDVQAITFANGRIRVAADSLAALYATAKSVTQSWNALSMSSKIPNTADVLVDGAASNGRPIITGAQATAIITRLIEFAADYEASSNAKLNTVLQVAPNP